MSIQAALKYELANGTNVSAITTRVYPAGDIPQRAARPYVTYIVIADMPVGHQGGRSGLTATSFQIDAWSDTEKAAAELQMAVRDDLVPSGVPFRGNMGDPGDPVVVRLAKESPADEDWFPPDDGSDRPLFRGTSHFEIWNTG